MRPEVKADDGEIVHRRIVGVPDNNREPFVIGQATGIGYLHRQVEDRRRLEVELRGVGQSDLARGGVERRDGSAVAQRDIDAIAYRHQSPRQFGRSAAEGAQPVFPAAVFRFVPTIEAGAVHPCHGDKNDIAVVVKIVDRDNMGVVETAGQAAFIFEEFHLGRGRRQCGVQQLDGDVKVQIPVMRPPDFPHAAVPQGLVEVEAVEQQLPRSGLIGEGRGHSGGGYPLAG